MSALRVYTVGASAALAICCLAVPVPALGLEPGVHADPGSPAAKQYSLPLNQARQTGAGPAGHEGSAANVPFGAGIKPPGTGGSSYSGAGAGQATSRGGAARPNATNNTAGRPSTLPAAVLRASSSQAGGDDSTLVLLGGAVAILILGGFGGILMRRSRGPISSS